MSVQLIFDFNIVLQLQVAVKFVEKKKVLEWVKVRTATFSLHLYCCSAVAWPAVLINEYVSYKSQCSVVNYYYYYYYYYYSFTTLCPGLPE